MMPSLSKNVWDDQGECVLQWLDNLQSQRRKANMVELETSGWMVMLETIELYQNCWALSTMEE